MYHKTEQVKLFHSLPLYDKFVSDLQQVSVLLRVFRLPSPMTDHHNITEIFLKMALH